MIVKILGIFDIFIAICFWIYGIYGLIPAGFIFVLGLFLLIKGGIFITNLSVASILDILSAVIIIISASIALPKILVIIVTLYLVQKGVFSLLI